MKKLLSYFIPTRAEKVTPKILPNIEVNVNNGKVHIDGKNVNYSFGSLHHVFRQAIKFKKQEIAQAKNALILGFGAGSIAKILLEEKQYDINITGVDFEPLMFELAQKYSGIKNFDKLNLIEADAKGYFHQCKETYNVIFIDLFVESKIPVFCFTDKFILDIKCHLSGSGLVVWNTLTQNNADLKILEIAKSVGFENTETHKVTADNVVVYIST